MSKSESENTFDPDKFITNDPGLNTSKLFKFYQLLDAQKETNNNIPASDVDEQKNKLSEQEKHVAELKKHLENIFSKWDSIYNSTDDGKIKCCEYLNYWLYGKIAERKLKFFRIRDLYNNLKEPKKEKSSIINEDVCTMNFIKNAPIEVLHNKKILYDFLEYYIYLNDEWSKIKENTKEKYCKYITHIFELYHKLYEDDRQWGLLRRYEKELSLFRDKFTNEKELSSLKSKCNIDNSLIESIKNIKTTDTLEENNFRGRATSNSYDNNFNNIKSEYEEILKELPSFQIYTELGNDVKGDEYKSVHCDKLSGSNHNNNIKKICKKLERNLTELPTHEKIKNETHTDQCLYLNFWIYDELSKIYDHTEENIFDVPEVANFLNADIEINKELIKKDWYTNYNRLFPPPPPKKITTEEDSENLDTTGVVQTSRENQTPPGNEANKGGQEGKESKVAEAHKVINGHESTANNQETQVSADNPRNQASGDNSGTQASGDNTGAQASGDEQKNKSPTDIINYKAYSTHNPCFFNYNCKFSECREMKHLYEYFKDYKTIKEKINCDQGKNDKYYKYLRYISSLYNKHKDEEGCCSWGTKMCPYYFLQCNEAYDPRKLIRALELGNSTECSRIKESAGVIKNAEAKSEEEKLRNSMYIKYMTCSYITGSHFNKKGLICQQQSQRPHINNKFLSRYSSYNPPINIPNPISKNITVNGKPMNVVLISNPNASIEAKNVDKSKIVDLDKSTSGYYSALFPEVTGNARAYYLEEAETACPQGKPVKGMSEYCRKSKQYNDIINGAKLQPEKSIEVSDIQNSENIDAPADDTSFLNDILQQLPVRMGAVSLASLGAVTMFFMYYKFTPLGSWLRNAIGGGEKMKHGNHGEPHIPLNYQQDHMPQFSQRKRIKIAYQTS